jgi:hypothetical protein
VVETGQFEGDALVFRGEFSTDEAKFGSRNATRVVAPRKIIPEEYIPMNGEHENSAGKSRSEEKIAERNASERREVTVLLRSGNP